MCQNRAMDEKSMALGRNWDGSEDLTGWYASEKLDGIRAYWDGTKCWTRGGLEIDLPASIRASLPAEPVDGEVYAGRGNLQAARLAVQNNRWTPEIRFVAHDMPGRAGNYAERMAFAPAHAVKVFQIRDEEHAVSASVEIMMGGGEGLVVRPQHDGYVIGRKAYLKIK